MISVQGVSKSFAARAVFADFHLEVGAGRIVALVGVNGCGKSTLLHLIAGLLHYDGGEVKLGVERPEEFHYMFQAYRSSLLPWRTCVQNMYYPLEIQRVDREVQAKRVQEFHQAFAVHIPLDAYPYQLSGGQQQIVAFLRGLISHPKLLLLDEPFSALDHSLKMSLLEAFHEYCWKQNTTVLLVTHSMEEAVFLADEIVILEGTPTRVGDVIHNPRQGQRRISYLTTEGFHRVKSSVIQQVYAKHHQ